MDLTPNDYASLRVLITRIKPEDFNEGVALAQLHAKLTNVLQQIAKAEEEQRRATTNEGPLPVGN